MTDEELLEIEARCNAATWGPWAYPHGGCVVSFSANRDVVACGGCLLPEDGEFITRAREDVPALIAEVRRLRAELVAYNSECVCTFELKHPVTRLKCDLLGEGD